MAASAFAGVSENGWITSELFCEWGKQFVAGLPKDDQRPHLLLMDGHSSHVYNVPFLQLMARNNVIVYLQPADKAFF